MTMEHLIAVARGDQPADLLLRNGKLVNVYSGEILEVDIAVAAGHVAGFGPRSARSEVDLQGRFVAPGFIDAHVHIESAMASPAEFARAVLPRGTTTVVADPHEIANVLGMAGIEYMLQSTASLPMQFFFTLSSCVPATSMETAGAALTAETLTPLMSHPRVVALAEMMNFPGVIQGDPSVMAKIRLARAPANAWTATPPVSKALPWTPISPPGSPVITSASPPPKPWKNCGAACTS
jgi:adenine deaminase